MKMSFKRIAKIFSRAVSSNSAVNCDEDNASSATTGSIDFTDPNANNKQLALEIKKGNVRKIKIFSDDLDILRDTMSFLQGSLVELSVRPKPIEYRPNENNQSSRECANPKSPRSSPEGFECINFNIESFVGCLCKFIHMKYLHFENDGIHAYGLSESIQEMRDLETVALPYCGISQMPGAFPANLKHIDLSCNPIKEISPAIFQIQHVESLILSKNVIHDVPKEINNLKYLKKLDLSHNSISSLPESITGLKWLMKLYLAGNKLKSLPATIGNLHSLKHLDLRDNFLTSVPDSIGDLFKLIKLTLCNNRLTALPETICKLAMADEALLLSGNPLHMPPMEVCLEGKQSMKGYFDALKQSSSIGSKRLKLVILGESFAGKTSLVHALVYGKDGNVAADQRTVGLDYYSWKPRPLTDELEILLVDCAGQRNYLLTHQFFLTEGALFLLVVDLDAYEMNDCSYRVKIGDWINMVISEVPGAVFVIVPTRLDKFKDDRRLVLDKCKDIMQRMNAEEKERISSLEKELELLQFYQFDQDSYEKLEYLKRTRPRLPQIVRLPETEEEPGPGFNNDYLVMSPVCCKNELEGVMQLRNEILRITESRYLCPIVDRKLPESWIALEEKLMALKNSLDMPLMSIDALTEMASETFNLTPEMIGSALSYFNAIGSIAYFKRVQKAEHLVFLNPEWLIQLLQKLFRHGHEDSLIYHEDFMTKLNLTEDEFEQDKEQLLTRGHLSRTLLRGIWLQMIESDSLLSEIVEILQYFGIICKLPTAENEDGSDIQYFITWFLEENEPEIVTREWNEETLLKVDDIVTRKDTGICQLPGSIFERLLLHAHARAELCHPWKSGFLIKKPHFKLKCEVKNGRTSSYVVLHGRCENRYCKEMWELILDIWKDFCTLAKELNGVVFRKSFSVCPFCVRKRLERPYLFQVEWAGKSPAKKQYSCHKCNSFVDCHLLRPPIESTGVHRSRVTQNGPITDAQLSTVATMLGTSHSEVALSLGLKQYHVQAAKANFQNSQYNQAMELFEKWKQKEGTADRMALIEAIRKLDPPRDDIIEFLETGVKPS